MSGPGSARFADGRLHLQHGPIDLVVEAFGQPAEVEAAYRQARSRFETVLEGLVAELGELRKPAPEIPRRFVGATALRMEAAVSPFFPAFVTPMAAVAGAVADEVLAAMLAGRRLARAYVNNGGDVALHLSPGERMMAAIAGAGTGPSDRIVIEASDPVRGIATSGWRGRSHSLGIADAVTVLARDAAAADAAATLIANAVDLPGNPAVARKPARELFPDSDLGDREVTVGVGALAPFEIDAALEQGVQLAELIRRRGLIVAAALFLGGRARVAGPVRAVPSREVREREREVPQHA